MIIIIVVVIGVDFRVGCRLSEVFFKLIYQKSLFFLIMLFLDLIMSYPFPMQVRANSALTVRHQSCRVCGQTHCRWNIVASPVSLVRTRCK